MNDDPVFGIDLGTTYSCIAKVDELSGKPTVLPNIEGDPTTPSVVFFEDEETRVVGKEAKNTAMLEPDRVVEMVKRVMGVPDWRETFFGREYTPEEISAYILRKVAGDVEPALGVRPKRVVITCPAYFGIPQRDATAAAGRIAGLDVLEVINEPTAAAIAYGLHDDSDQVVLVYDLGGGTFDVTVIEIKDGSVLVAATGGDHLLGGRDWDEQVVKFLAEEWQRETGAEQSPLDSPATVQDLWLRAETAKRTLSSRAQTKVPVTHDGQQATVTLTRERFDELTQHLLANTITYTQSVLSTAAGLGRGPIDRVLLVGGATKMPQIPERLQAEFGELDIKSFEPDQAVAKGAAIYGHKLAIDERIRTVIADTLDTTPDRVDEAEVAPDVRERAQEVVAEQLGLRIGPVQKLNDMQITNVASHSFGVIVQDWRSDSPNPGREIISNLVLAQQSLPAKRTAEYGTVEDNQSTVELRILENNERDDWVEDPSVGDQIGNAVLHLIAGLPKSSPIEVTFVLNREGRLHVTGRDLSADGQTVETTIETGGALSGEQLAAAVEHARGIKVTG